jgi:quinol monooxygenase YgiN
MTEKLYTIAVLPAAQGKTDVLIDHLETLAEQTRKEAGCIEYGFYRDQRTPSVVLSYEVWQDAEAEAAHWGTPHLTQAIEAFEHLLDGQPIIYKGPRII